MAAAKKLALAMLVACVRVRLRLAMSSGMRKEKTTPSAESIAQPALQVQKTRRVFLSASLYQLSMATLASLPYRA